MYPNSFYIGESAVNDDNWALGYEQNDSECFSEMYFMDLGLLTSTINPCP